MKTRPYYLYLLLLVFVWQANATEDWETDLTKAIAAAKEADRPVLVYFTASWCGPCRLMKRTTLSDPKVNERLGSFTKVLLDFDTQGEIAKKYDVQGIPAFVVLSSAGDSVAKSIGYMDAAPFEEMLNQGLAAAAFAAGQEKVFAETIARLEDRLGSSTKGDRVQALDSLLDFCSSPERIEREYGAKKVKEMGEADPLFLLNGLDHAKLAGRIEVSRILQEQLGEEFQFDPWLAQPERSARAAGLKVKFSKADK